MSQTSSLDLLIHVIDIDDEMPHCALSKYEAKIMEDAQKLVPLTMSNAQELVVFDNDDVIKYIIKNAQVLIILCRRKMASFYCH